MEHLARRPPGVLSYSAGTTLVSRISGNAQLHRLLLHMMHACKKEFAGQRARCELAKLARMTRPRASLAYRSFRYAAMLAWLITTCFLLYSLLFVIVSHSPPCTLT